MGGGGGADETDDDAPPMEWGRAMRLNKPESTYIALGCFGALVCGSVQPAFAIAFAEMLGVRSTPPFFPQQSPPPPPARSYHRLLNSV